MVHALKIINFISFRVSNWHRYEMEMEMGSSVQSFADITSLLSIISKHLLVYPRLFLSQWYQRVMNTFCASV